MTFALTSRRAVLAPGQWVRNELWRRARAVPSLDLRFAESKSLVDATTGSNLVTFTRASSGTFVGSDGQIKTATTNLLLRSEEFDNASWSNSQSTDSANTAVAPNGATTADSLIENSAAGVQHYTQQLVTVAANTLHTVSLFVKANTRSSIRFGLLNNTLGSGAFAHFNATTGAISSQTTAGTATSVSYSIEPYANGWYRCRVSCVIDASSTTAAVFIGLVDGSNNATYTGNGTSGIYLWGAQLEAGAFPTSYIPTTSAINSAPRFDHNPTTGESLGLLVEEQRTNSIRNNTMVGAVAGTPGTNPTNWSYVTTQSNGLTQSVVGTGTENGITYVDYRFYGTTVNTNAIAIGIDFGTAATGQTWTGSTYWKLVGGSLTGITSQTIGLIEQTSGGSFVSGAFYTVSTPTSASLISQRATATRTLSGGATVAQCFMPLQINVAGSTAIDFTLRIGLPQLEQGAFATSVIPTSGTAVTRSADVVSISGSNFSAWYRQDAVSVFSQSTKSSTSTGAPFSINDGTTSNRISGLIVPSANFTAARNTAGAGTLFTPGTANQPIVGLNKIAQASANFDHAVVLNGGSVATAATYGMPVVDRLEIGSQLTGSFINGSLARLTIWPTRLPNSTLQAMTQ